MRFRFSARFFHGNVAVLATCAVLAGQPVMAQQVYRCAAAQGAAPEYINNTKEAQARGCKVMEGGNVTVVQSVPVPKPQVRAASTSPAAPAPRSDGGADQKARDSDARTILESELKKAESKLAEQQKEFNNGQPDKQGIEGRNHQRYLDRVAEMKDNLARSESDVAGLKRELARLPTAN